MGLGFGLGWTGTIGLRVRVKGRWIRLGLDYMLVGESGVTWGA